MHPHGVFYDKDSEGAPYNDGTARRTTRRTTPSRRGGTHTYTWEVPERAGPGPNDGSSVMWMYHSHTDEVGDTYAGLMGPMDDHRARAWRARTAAPKDVDREVFVLFSVMDENAQPLPATQHRSASPKRPSVRPATTRSSTRAT